MGKQKSGDQASDQHSGSTLVQYQKSEHENHDTSNFYGRSRISILSPTKKDKNNEKNLLIWDQDCDQDAITIYRVTISTKKLKQIMTKEQIQNQAKNINELLQKKGSYHFFNYFPNQLFPTVTEFTGCHFSPRRMMMNSSIKQISQINFNNMVELYLADQLLYSVEALSFLNAPKLIKLSIKRNKITNLNSLVKSEFPNLQQLQYYLNPINSMQNLHRFHPKKFKYLVCYNHQQSFNLISQNKMAFTSQFEGEKFAILHNKIDDYYGLEYKFLKQLVW